MFEPLLAGPERDRAPVLVVRRRGAFGAAAWSVASPPDVGASETADPRGSFRLSGEPPAPTARAAADPLGLRRRRGRAVAAAPSPEGALA
ncbi:MAG TPA: hypothetical protein DIT48_06050, partial [Actinobacteria bacterium]|nr:hypothetical protein [Actinomycetota bacterium]